jgi:glutaredoxin-related protein
MENTYEKRFKLNQLNTFNKAVCEETLMLLRYLYRREEDLEYRVEISRSMEQLERRIKELALAEPQE